MNTISIENSDSKHKYLNICSSIRCSIRVILEWKNVHVIAVSKKNVRSSIFVPTNVVRDANILMQIHSAQGWLPLIRTWWLRISGVTGKQIGSVAVKWIFLMHSDKIEWKERAACETKRRCHEIRPTSNPFFRSLYFASISRYITRLVIKGIT